ncbi:histidine kinase [Lysobacter sp. BMK333-48F3]|uniref:sensor histidine kinase n=1 Tax=Lysobacter sp. BMK333-48F3 TaxID=2867962 RepID=UPI001C8B927E|nr:histidine kinase [Lysobacter sp. BMK333-48F3]MBX9401643.1 histidine kinase [Lysobacter sp. BMK333-48F3]
MNASADDLDRRNDEPPFWLPLLAALPLAACLLLSAVPILGQGAASASRTMYLWAFVLWLLPLTALQRALRQRWSLATTAAVLLPATFLMAWASRWLLLLPPLLARGSLPPHFDWAMSLRGLEGTWLSLVAACAIHAVVAYAVQLRRERERVAQAQAWARDAELTALRYQLQPHFLFNTLNAVSALIGEGQGGQAQRMLARLSEFLRATLDGGRGHEVSLAEELALTEAYLEIEQARLGERLRLRWQIGAGVLSARVPYLLLQPLVENAVRHGIARRSAPGRIDLDIAADGDALRIEIVNDPATTPATTADGDADPAPAGGTIGLRNVRERLQALYPQRHAFEAGIDGDGRYRVRLRLPLQPVLAAADTQEAR